MTAEKTTGMAKMNLHDTKADATEARKNDAISGRTRAGSDLAIAASCQSSTACRSR